MQKLTVIRAERDRLIVATDAGETFALPIDDALRAEVRRRRPQPDAASSAGGPKPSPREIQAHIRSGMSSEEVAALLGVGIDEVQRFEGPVLAEREHMLGLALAVPVLLAAVDDVDARPTFGEAIRAKLTEAGASGERWTSWKEADGWVIKLEFRVGDVDHDARWSFDAKRSALAPQNADATQLSRQGSLPEGLIPRLRALDKPTIKDESRFDSGAFGPRHDTPDTEVAETTRTAPATATDAAIKRAPDTPVTSAETADLLEALRRRRGQREASPATDTSPAAPAAHGATPIALFDALEPGFNGIAEEASSDQEPVAVPDSAQRRRGRAALPSWDEIVFGARGDGD